jgi:hypothetical protein
MNYSHCCWSILVLCSAILISTNSASAQSRAPDDGPQHPDAASSAPRSDVQQHEMAQMHMDDNQMTMRPAREGSGTSWLPDETPTYGGHRRAGSWTLMAQGSAFLQYLHDGSDRGAEQFGSINWIMGMADRKLGRGRLGLKAMISLEPATIGGCGYPNLLASGEVCNGEAIHDRQHPHDLFMELAASYDRPLAGSVRWQVYGGPVGEPALGPTAFPHRISAMLNPLAPITHHWFDSTHITFGVVTGGIYGEHWKTEGSMFNGREPDEHRTNVDFGALDSWSARVWVLPADRWALQLSGGHLAEAEAGHDGGVPVDLDRITASATYHRRLHDRGISATTAGWGRNKELGNSVTNALVVETSLTLQDRDALFGRFELSEKSGNDLGVESHDLFTVAKLQGGYTRYLDSWRGLKPGAGIALSLAMVPQPLQPVYGRRVAFGIGFYLTLRPAESAMGMN